jgi:ADP-ribosylglycohydrolase
MASMTAEQLPQVRGSVLGLVLGDAIGVTGGDVPAHGVLRSTCAGQLACYTLEGLIRAMVRWESKGICHPPTVVWHAYHRWAKVQGIPGVEEWGDPGGEWPDGWLAQVPVLTERRGSAPATVRALQHQVAGSLDRPVGTSLGAHGLTRSLPAGLVGVSGRPSGRLAAEIAVLTHRDEAVGAAAMGATLVGLLADGVSLSDAVEAAQRLWSAHSAEPDLAPEDRAVAGLVDPTVAAVEAAVAAARSSAGQVSVMKRLASDKRAVSALAGGLYAALSAPAGQPSLQGQDSLRAALLLAASAGDGGHAAAVAGAMLGAANGIDALPLEWLSRLELVWVADVLAHDTVRQLTEDPDWWHRYPGW